MNQVHRALLCSPRSLAFTASGSPSFSTKLGFDVDERLLLKIEVFAVSECVFDCLFARSKEDKRE